ncbi:unnamed protein product [Nesidiocoris tenuis]|uniref:Uncharacterized protein n=1 Tax=Nesidiocoris tenuis TaxID=355587 RepID=A0A6H5HBB8_9HEMI|nr:unnamed protein product [Nesidiocoris tenuis]CAB0015760.1 unnamed protein product [Nesidiocoris tenuis]
MNTVASNGKQCRSAARAERIAIAFTRKLCPIARRRKSSGGNCRFSRYFIAGLKRRTRHVEVSHYRHLRGTVNLERLCLHIIGCALRRHERQIVDALLSRTRSFARKSALPRLPCSSSIPRPIGIELSQCTGGFNKPTITGLLMALIGKGIAISGHYGCHDCHLQRPSITINNLKSCPAQEPISFHRLSFRIGITLTD